MVVVIGTAAPEQQKMEPGKDLLPEEGFMLVQKTSLCCKCLCCQPNIDWLVQEYNENWSWDNVPTARIMMYVKEEAPYIGRCCSHSYPGARPTRHTVHAGASEAGEVLFMHEKGLTCSARPLLGYNREGDPVRCIWCCCLPYLETKTPGGELLGTSKLLCHYCIFVPRFSLKDSSGQPVYLIRPETCCFGCCVKCRCGGQGGKCCRLPFVIRDPVTENPVGNEAAITDLWTGFQRECCSRRHAYSIKFPPGAKPDVQKTLMGMALLIDLAIFEQQD